MLQSELNAVDSVYFYNFANLGGVFYTIQKSKLTLQGSILIFNAAKDSSVLYGLANEESESIQFLKSIIWNNYARSMSIYLSTTDMLVRGCDFRNNRAIVGTHGFQTV